MEFIPCYCEMLLCDSTLWIPGRHFGWTDRVWNTQIATPISREPLGVWEKWCHHTSVPGHTVRDTLITTPISWEQLGVWEKIMSPHVCARPHCAGYTDHNTNLMGATWSVRKNYVTTRLCQATLCGIHWSQHQSHWSNLECEKNDVNTRLCQATLCGIHWSQHQSHGNNFGVWEKLCYHTSVPGHTVRDTLITTPISWEQLGVWEKWC